MIFKLPTISWLVGDNPGGYWQYTEAEMHAYGATCVAAYRKFLAQRARNGTKQYVPQEVVEAVRALPICNYKHAYKLFPMAEKTYTKIIKRRSPYSE